MLGEEVLYLSVRELQAHLRRRSFSPVELAQSYLDRAQKIGPKLNAFATLTPELALEQARKAEKEILAKHHRGPLHGVPYALKDLIAVKGYKTTWGAPPFANQTIDCDATIVEKAEQCRCGINRQSGHDRARRRSWIFERKRIAHRTLQEPLEHGVLDVRFVQRIGRNCRSRAGAVGSGL